MVGPGKHRDARAQSQKCNGSTAIFVCHGGATNVAPAPPLVAANCIENGVPSIGTMVDGAANGNGVVTFGKWSVIQ